MGSDVLGLEQIDRTQVAVAGGKAAHLGELCRVDGIRVPPGFCVTTAVFRRVLAQAPELDGLLQRLSRLDPADAAGIRVRSAEVRATVEGLALPDDVAAAITGALARLGDREAYAVRSSATAEDLPTAAFAGQQDTYLNVVGPAAVLDHVRRCWASLFTERAVTYRLRNDLGAHRVDMAVIVQRMVVARAAGVLFTADPVTSNRKVAAVEATVGLGESLVAGLVDADRYRVRDGEIVARAVATKRLALRPSPDGGTRPQPIPAEHQEEPALTDEQVVDLVRLGRRIAAHFGCPQDIEWCLAGDGFHIVQSRPITTLFPIPDADDDEHHVYVSVGHQQMMTDAMKPLGISLWQLTAGRPMFEAGGRLFVDVAQALASPASRAGLLEIMGRGDPLIRDALETVLERGDVIPSAPHDDAGSTPPHAAPPAPGGAPAPIAADPAIVAELIAGNEASLADLQREIAGRSGPALLDFILSDLQELKRLLVDPRSFQVFMTAMEATWWLNDHLREWLGEKNMADALTQSVPDNVTSRMGLALLDVADVVRRHPQVVAFLEGVGDVAGDGFLDELAALDGGREARDAISGYLDTYGMRCVGEIDITRPRWSERPAALLPMLLANVRSFAPGEARRRFAQGRQAALRAERDILQRLRALPDGESKAAEAKQMIDRVRTFIGYREYPKYSMVSRYFVYKLALLGEAERLVAAGVLQAAEDIFFLRFAELHDVVRTRRADAELIRRRKADFRSAQALTPPRVLTSEGEAVEGAYRRDAVPDGALIGLPVSAGTVEGRARVVFDVADAGIEPGDILVTVHTDPSWSPLFVAITGLVTEVGGQMTHGAVIAREYGLPAVVGVAQATRSIRDGQRIRVNGTEGYVEVLSDDTT